MDDLWREPWLWYLLGAVVAAFGVFVRVLTARTLRTVAPTSRDGREQLSWQHWGRGFVALGLGAIMTMGVRQWAGTDQAFLAFVGPTVLFARHAVHGWRAWPAE